MPKFSLLVLCFGTFLFFGVPLQAQFKLNEASNANGSTLILPDGSSPDWIEIYNAGASSANINGYSLSDDRNQLRKWMFPPAFIGGNQVLTVYASDNSSVNAIDHFESAVFAEDVWQYFIPSSEVPAWTSTSFNSSSWPVGQMSIGFGDGDDSTELTPPITTLYYRIYFEEIDTSAIKKAILDIDYDDGFVAYLNGVEIARDGLSGIPPVWDELAVNHEAQLYQGGIITSFEIPMNTIQNALVNGTNVLAVELHNTAPLSSDLTCIPYLTFGYDRQGTFHNGTVHQYFGTAIAGNLETNFGIKSSGETIYLSDPNGFIIDSLVVPDLEPDMSCGKQPDGIDSYFIFPIPTPDASNNTSTGYIGYEAQPEIVPSGGIYSGTVSVIIVNNSTQSGVIRYTTDGSDPDIESSIFFGPIALNSNCVLKVSCFPNGSNMLPSLTSTETFLFNEDFTIPILSLTIDEEDLYGPNGIFDNWWTDWKKPCVMEYFDKNGIKRFETRSSVKIDGGAGGSRSNPQHSMTVEPANSTFGEGEPVQYAMFPEKPFIHEFYALYIRNGSNYWNQYPEKDATFCRIMRNTHVNSEAYTPAVVFLNGNYFGIYEIREKMNEGYFKNNYENDLDSVDILSVSYFYGAGVLRTVKGSDSSFYSMRDLIVHPNSTSSDKFDEYNQKLDLYNFTDYIIGENWYANVDWIYNNMKLARSRTYDNKWKFFLQDVELGLGGWTDFNQNMFDHFRWNNQPNPFWEIYNGLIQTPEFKNYFINRYADLMNTIFRNDYYQPVVDSMYNELLPELPRHFELWTGDVTGGMQTYANIRNNILYQFSNRNPVVRDQIVDEYGLEEHIDVTLDVSPQDAGRIKISTIIPDSLPWTGVYFNGNPVLLTAIPNPGYTFENWQPNVCIPFGSTNQSLNLNITNNCTFTAQFSGSTQNPKVTFSEINYHSDSTKNAGDWIEIHNYADFPLDISEWTFNDTVYFHTFAFSTGTVLAPDEYLVLASDTVRFKERFPDIQPHGLLNFEFSNSSENLSLSDKDKQPVIEVRYSDSIPWPICADGYGRTLELKNDTTNLNNPESWFGGCMEGSPGSPYVQCNEQLIFSEINYNSSSLEDAGDWVELYNTTGSPFDLSGLSFKDNNDNHVFFIPQNTLIPAYGHLVLYNNDVLFAQQHPDVTNTTGPFNFGLSNEGEVIRLYDTENRILFSMAYQAIDPWPLQANAGGYTLEYDLTKYDFSNGENWFAGCPQGSPGKSFGECTDTSIIINTDIFIYPNPASNQFSVNGSMNMKSMEIINMLGECVYASYDTVEQNTCTINTSTLRTGIYLVKLDYGIFRRIIKLMIL
jgi:hypothetical protein